MDTGDKQKLARIDANVTNLDKSFGAHEKLDSERFDRVFNFTKEGFAKLENHFDKIEDRLDTLWDGKNRQEGAFGLGKIIAGSIGGFLVAIIDFLFYSGGHIK